MDGRGRGTDLSHEQPSSPKNWASAQEEGQSLAKNSPESEASTASTQQEDQDSREVRVTSNSVLGRVAMVQGMVEAHGWRQSVNDHSKEDTVSANLRDRAFG